MKNKLFDLTLIKILILSVFVIKMDCQNLPAEATDTNSLIKISGQIIQIDVAQRLLRVRTNDSKEITVSVKEKIVIIQTRLTETREASKLQIKFEDINKGDLLAVRGKQTEANLIVALQIVIMKEDDVKEKITHNQTEWKNKSISGVVTEVIPTTKQIKIKAKLEIDTEVILNTSQITKYFNFSDKTTKFSETQPSEFSAIKVGDQVQVLGEKSSTANELNVSAIVFGTFKTILGTVSEIDKATYEVKILDSQSKKTLTLLISKETVLRELPKKTAEQIVKQAKADTKNSLSEQNDLGSLLREIPAVSSELQVNDVIIVSFIVSSASKTVAYVVIKKAEPLLDLVTKKNFNFNLLSPTSGINLGIVTQ